MKRIEKEREEKMKEAGITPEDLLKSFEIEEKEEDIVDTLVIKGLETVEMSGLFDKKEFIDIVSDFQKKSVDLKEEFKETGEVTLPDDMIKLFRKAEKVTGLDGDPDYEPVPKKIIGKKVSEEKEDTSEESTLSSEEEKGEDKSWFNGGVEKPWFGE